MRPGDRVYPIVAEVEGVEIAGDLSHLETSLNEAGFEVWPSLTDLMEGRTTISYTNTRGKLIKGSLASDSRESGWIYKRSKEKDYVLIVPYLNEKLERFAEEYEPVAPGVVAS